MTKDEALKLALDDLMIEYDMERTSFAKRVDEIFKQALAAPVQEPVAWVDLLKQAKEIIQSKPLWNRFIKGTPLGNDIAVCMASFAQEHTTPPAAQPASVQKKSQQFTSEMNYSNNFKQGERNFCPRCGKRAGDYIHTCTPPQEQK